MVNAPEVMVGKSTEERTLELDILNIDPNYQRHGKGRRKLVDAHVEKIKREFDPKAVLFIIVNERQDGTFWVIDGAHRVFALIDLGYTHWECLVYRHLTYQEEATIFHKLNNKKSLTARLQFEARVIGGEPKAVDIVRICRQHGFDIKSNVKQLPSFIRSTVVLDKIYDAMGATVLSETMYILSKCWNRSERDQLDKVTSNVLGGMALFVQTYGASNTLGFTDFIKPDDVIKMMRSLKITDLISITDSIFTIEKPPTKKVAAAKGILMHVQSKSTRHIVDLINRKYKWGGLGGIRTITSTSPLNYPSNADVAYGMKSVFDD